MERSFVVDNFKETPVEQNPVTQPIFPQHYGTVAQGLVYFGADNLVYGVDEVEF